MQEMHISDNEGKEKSAYKLASSMSCTLLDLKMRLQQEKGKGELTPEEEEEAGDRVWAGSS